MYNPLHIMKGMQDVIESDFNPDIVELFGIDMWEAGFRNGIGIGVTGAFMGLGAICVVHKIYTDIKKKKKC